MKPLLTLCALLALSGCTLLRPNASSAPFDITQPHVFRMTAGPTPPAQQVINIGTAPNSGNGDPLRTAFGKDNTNVTALFSMFGTSSNLFNNGSALATDIAGLFANCGPSAPVLGYQGACLSGGGGGGASTFDQIGSGNNVGHTLTVGSGSIFGPASVSPGTVNANQVNGGNLPASAGVLGTNSSGQIVVGSGSGINGANNTIACNNSGSTGSLNPCSAPNALGVILSAAANPQTGTTYTLALTDANGEVTMSNASANTLTIPPNSSVPFPINAVFTVEQTGAGLTTIALGAGVSVQNGSRYSYTSLGGQFGYEQFQQVSTNVWLLVKQHLGNAKFSITGGTCTTPASTTGGAQGGTITLAASGNVNACTLIITPTVAAATLWTGTMFDQTQQAIPSWMQSAQNAASLTFTLPGQTAANDVLTTQFNPQ